MILSDATLELLIDVAGDKLSTILRGIQRDAWDAGLIRDHCPILTALANVAEAGEDPRAALRMLRIIEASNPTPAPAYRRQVPSDWAAIRDRIFLRDGAVCAYCGDLGGPFHIDHVHPLRLGGTSADDNLCVACAPCNLSKRDRTVERWRGSTP